jgi:hypothetical protein
MRFISFIFSHSFFVASCAMALCIETAWVVGMAPNTALYLFVGCATLASYNFHIIMGSFYNGGRLAAALWQHPLAVLFIVLPGLAMLWLLPGLRAQWPQLALAVAATGLYSLALLPYKWLAWVRRLGFAKTLLLAATWTFVTAWLPMAKYFAQPGPAALMFLLHRFCLMLQICLLFDVRDTAIDKIKGLHSLATDMGPVAAHRLFYALSAACTGLALLLAIGWGWYGPAIAYGAVQAAAIALYRVPLARRGYFYYYFLVDGLMLLCALLATVAVWAGGGAGAQ